MISTPDCPALVSDLCNPDWKWRISPNDYGKIEALTPKDADLNVSRIRSLGTALLDSLAGVAVTFDARHFMPTQGSSDGEALLGLVLASRCGQCNLTLLQCVAERGPRLEAAAIACAPFSGADGRTFISECKGRIVESMNAQRLYWLFSIAAKIDVHDLLTSDEFLALLNQLSGNECGALLRCVGCVSRVSVAMLETVASRAEDISLYQACATALKMICERAEELGENVSISTKRLMDLSRVIQ